MSETPELAPKPRPTRRLNNTALVLLSLAGALLLATLVYYLSQRPAPSAIPAAPPRPPETESAEPGFYRRPPRSAPETAPLPLSPGRSSSPDPAELAAIEALARDGAPPSSPASSETSLPGAAGAGGPYRPSYSPPLAYATAAAAPADPRREAYQRALRAPMSIAGTSSLGAAAPAGDPAPSSLPGFPALPALHIPGLTEPLPEPARSPQPPQDPTTSFLAEARQPRDPRLPVTVDPPVSTTQLDAGSLIPAVLATGINSDLPGDLVAQVTRDVFDSRTQSRVLIPRGARLLGRYQSQVSAGQRRLLVAWDRLIFPDGSSLRFPGLPGLSPTGEAGLSASVDNHLPTVFGSAILLSFLSAGAQLSQPQQSATFGQAASTGQVGAAALGQELSSVSTELLRRRLAIPPTLRVASGTEFQVLVRADLALPPYLR